MRNSFVDTIVSECDKRDDIIVLSGDAGLGVFDQLKSGYPSKFLNMGIAEQNMMSFAAGLALTGFKVYVYNIIPFLLYRCYEQVRNDICDQELPVVLVGVGSGVTYAPSGMSHYAVEDLGIARTLPNLAVISPADPVEAEAAARYSLYSQTPVYVRMAKRGEPRIHQNDDIDITVPQVIREGAGSAIVFHGSISEEVMKAHQELIKNNVHPLLLSVPMVQPLNAGVLIDMLKNMKFVVSIEEHYESTGLGSILKKLVFDYSPPWKLKAIGIPDGFIHTVHDTNNMRKRLGISSEKILQAIYELNRENG